MRRTPAEELLDSDRGSPREVDSALRSLRRVNRFYGGNTMHIRLLRQIAGRHRSRRLRVLEVASGRADALQAGVKALQGEGIHVETALLDRSALHLPAAPDWDRRYRAPNLLVGDALDLPLAPESVDVVSCCLFLHHLSEEEIDAFLTEALRVSTVAVVINDLERHRFHYWLSLLARVIDPSRLSKHDGPASVKQAYTGPELKTILQRSGCSFHLERGFLFRLGAVIWKNSSN